MSRLYARALPGERVVGTVPQNWGDNLSVIAALGAEGLTACMTVNGATDSEVFQIFVDEVLGPTLKPGDIVILDNLSVHKKAEVEKSIKARGVRVIFLPPYSPDLSPIERGWSKIKAYLRKVGARSREALDKAISEAISLVTSSDSRSWFEFCGYALH